MTKIQLQTTLPKEMEGHRLDQALAETLPQYSRSQLQQWIKSNTVKVNGHIQNRPREKVFGGEQIEIDTVLDAKENWSAQDLPLNIVYEDEALIVINKPAGLVVHPGAGNPDGTLVNALLNYDQRLEILPRSGIVHRLDKDTTGLLVVARTLETHNHLVQAINARTVERHYQAIVQGRMLSGGTVNAAMGRHPTMRTKMAVTPTGKTAITHYRVLERFLFHTYVGLKLETGRTHQIRVHLSHIHFPIVGDPVYYKTRGAHKEIPDLLKTALHEFHRQALHACQLSLIHPLTHKQMTWKAALPEDMQHLLDVLQSTYTEDSDE